MEADIRLQLVDLTGDKDLYSFIRRTIDEGYIIHPTAAFPNNGRAFYVGVTLWWYNA